MAEKLKRSGKEARDKFELEVLPQLQEELEGLKEKLGLQKKENTPEQQNV